MRVELQPAYLLHARPYRDTSLLLDLLTEDYGRVAAVSRGVRSGRKQSARLRGTLQPFIPLLVSWSGRSELKSCRHVEAAGAANHLPGKVLYSGFYLNEILLRLLAQDDPHPELYVAYQQALQLLELGEESADIALRRFELSLLDQLGYGIALDSTANGEALHPERRYHFQPQVGLVESLQDDSHDFLGADLIGLVAADYTPSVRRSAKRLCRQLLHPYLGDKPLKSRELFG